ncbi:hypothetical protein [Parapedobacter tibetensis]|uniref:hypothetical protein n=1 Tax=Parapedobacter tibetensis TaxID=2972951 RepID=UPI00214D2970|nr:hypothetical protein [Parapedobacter tibetensis]
MRHAAIYYRDLLAGILTETDDGEYIFHIQAKVTGMKKPSADRRTAPIFLMTD